jgi:pyruvate/2-oxoacid:ferredoxin oxidoreductase alpha subunit
MGSVNTYNRKIDTTVQIFDRFYGYQQDVQAVEYDAVSSYFQSVFKNKEAADNFAVTLFRISRTTGTPVMTLLQQFQGMSGPQITLTLAFYLNGIRSRSTLLGLNVPTQSNYYVAHNIRI